jgi:hypothetical protein
MHERVAEQLRLNISLGEMRRKSYSPEGARKESCPSSRCKKGKSNDG